MTFDPRTLADPVFFSRLDNLELRARGIVEGFMHGLHRSPFVGFSVEFAEHRPYMPGDSIRNIDWKVYAKSDRFYIKQYEEETNLRSYILLDTSRSMTYAGPGAISKLEYAKHLAAALAYMMIHQQDAVGLLLFSDVIHRFVPPRSAGRHLQLILRELEGLEPGTNTDVATCLSTLSERIRRRGLIILISDLMDEPERVLQGLKHFRYKQHEVIVFQILDETEWTFPFRDELGFVDLETGEEIIAQSWILAEEYRRRVDAWREDYRRACGEQQIDLVSLTNQTPFDRALMRFLEKRARLH